MFSAPYYYPYVPYYGSYYPAYQPYRQPDRNVHAGLVFIGKFEGMCFFVAKPKYDTALMVGTRPMNHFFFSERTAPSY